MLLMQIAKTTRNTRIGSCISFIFYQKYRVATRLKKLQKMKKLENGRNFECKAGKAEKTQISLLFSSLPEKAEFSWNTYEIGGFLEGT